MINSYKIYADPRAFKMTCVAVKKDKSVCGNTAKYTHPSDGSPRCGTHMRDVEDRDKHLIAGAKPSASRSSGGGKTSVSTNLNVVEVWNAMCDRLTRNLCTMPVSSSDKAAVQSIGEMEPPMMDTFIKGLIKACPPRKLESGSELDLDRMIVETNEKLKSFNLALREKFNPDDVKFYPQCLPDNVLVIEALPGLIEEDNYLDLDENGSIIHHKDVNITVMNCKTAVGPFMREWLENPENIYIGPSFVFPKLFDHDSEYFIPTDDRFASRLIQNKHDIKRIIEDLKSGQESPSKYLALEGKTLGGTSVPYPCHSEVYVEVLRWLKRNPPSKPNEATVER